MASVLPAAVTAILERAANLSEIEINRLIGPGALPAAEAQLMDPRADEASTDAYLAARQCASRNELAMLDAFLNAALFADAGVTDVLALTKRSVAILTAGNAALAVLAREHLTDGMFEVLYGPWRMVE